MKNIHILPTTQPSKLGYISESQTYHLYNNDVFLDELANAINIYITSDEKIKEGDWIENNGKIYKCTATDNFYVTVYEKNKYAGSFDTYTCKKIILSTDPTLIADGVQAIDDEFLEWFVKNSSCEFVEVVKEGYKKNSMIDEATSYRYKIIIPKEEPKQELDKDWKELEAAEKYSQGWGENDDVKSFIAGANWQAERMYSEEDLKQFGLYLGDNFKKLKGKTIDEIFEQFKKK
jgi:hypothetical protein